MAKAKPTIYEERFKRFDAEAKLDKIVNLIDDLIRETSTIETIKRRLAELESRNGY